jgi:S1-C subfamily serine protease
LVVAVPKGRAAEKAGLKRRDFIVAIDGRKLENPQAIGAVLRELVEKHEVGDRLRLTVRRPPRGEEVEIELPLSRAFD